MPKIDIDYSNTIIYKITCKDTNVKDVYVGHTTNFVQRKHAHKQSCINMKSSNYKCKLYEAIRNNGGWNNWKMEIVGFFNCKDHYEARIKEQEYFVLLQATLNSIEPMPKPKCKEKSIPKLKKQDKSVNKIEYYCEICEYKTRNKKDYNKHILTSKHQKNVLLTQQRISLTNTKQDTILPNTCDLCNKCYGSRVGLWYHKKKCIGVNDMTGVINKTTDDENKVSITNNIPMELILQVIKQSKEIQNVLVEQNKELQAKLLEQGEKLLEKENLVIDQQKQLIELAKKRNSEIK